MVFYNETLAVQYSYTFSAAVIAAYDAALTISREVRQIWKGKFSAVTVLYLILRWGTLTHTILDLLLIVYVAPPSILSCKFIYAIGNILDVLCLFCVAIFSALRVWAIAATHSRDTKYRSLMALLVLTPSLFIPCVNIYNYTNYDLNTIVIFPDDSEGGGCGFTEIRTIPPPSLPMTTRAIAMATDALVLILTWTNTYGWKFDREHLHHVQQITELIIQNGMVYFTALLVLNIVALIFDVNDERLPATQFTIINSVLTNVLICRFILDLRDASFTPDDLSQISSVRFVGNIGAPLDVQHCSVPPGGEDWDAGELDVEEVLSVGPSRALEDCETKSEV